MKNYKSTTKKVDSLIHYINNSRTHSEAQIDQIIKSITEFGFTNPVLITPENMVVAGHGRLEAAKRMGIKSVPVVILDGLSDEQIRAYVIADNKLALNSGWDENMLAAEMQALSESGYDLDLIGFDPDEIGRMIDLELEQDDIETGTERPNPVHVSVGRTEAKVYNSDADEIPEIPKVPITKMGDVWVMGSHRLMCGDSTSLDAVAVLMGGDKADLLITDPPYNVNYEGATKEKLTIQNDSMGDDLFFKFLTDCYGAANSVMRPGAVFYIWHADSEGYNFRGAATGGEEVTVYPPSKKSTTTPVFTFKK